MIASLKGVDRSDFLARPALESPPKEVLSTISRMPMLITGAGGSIGSALALRLSRLALPVLLLLDELFAAHAPRIVFHMAAHKHVPLLEQQPLAAIANNIFATETIAATAATCGARVVLLSTDKAVESISVIGATKRVAEEIVLAAGGTVLRLGNVLASTGSVTEVFAHQIARGGPLTITDPAAHRYFLTLDEPVNLLLFMSAAPPRAGKSASELRRG